MAKVCLSFQKYTQESRNLIYFIEKNFVLSFYSIFKAGSSSKETLSIQEVEKTFWKVITNENKSLWSVNYNDMYLDNNSHVAQLCQFYADTIIESLL